LQFLKVLLYTSDNKPGIINIIRSTAALNTSKEFDVISELLQYFVIDKDASRVRFLESFGGQYLSQNLSESHIIAPFHLKEDNLVIL
jgi:type IV secretory pathway VirB4 component